MSLNNWEVKKIEKLFDIGRGRVISENEINSNLGDYPVYSSQTANKGEFGRVSFYEFEGEYITWTTDGANAGTVFYRNGRFNCTNVCGTLKAKNINEVHTLFFSYLIDREAFKHVAVVGNNKLMNNVMGKIKLSYPKNYSEQKTIAAILSKVDEAIAAVEDSIKATEKVKKALMQNLLTGKLKPDGTWRSEDEFYTDEKFGKIPKGWEIQQLKDIAKIQRGKFAHRPRNEPRFYGGQYPFIQTSDIVNAGIYVNNHLQTLNETGLAISKIFPAGTIAITIAITIAANIGDVAILKYEMCFPDSLIGIIPHSLISSEYLALFLTTQKNLLNQFATESAQKNINYSALRPLEILFPNDSKEQSKIVGILLNIEKNIETKQAKIETLKKLKKSLMQNLFTGKIRINPSQFPQEISHFS